MNPAFLAVALAAWTDAPPMTADPAEILAAVATLTAPAEDDDGVDVLLSEWTWTAHADGTRDLEHHQVMRILDASGVESMTSFPISWSPGKDLRPEVRGRVISPGGAVVAVDPAQISEANQPSVEPWGTLRRTLRVPVPQVAPGAIIETVSTHRTGPARVAGGHNGVWDLSRDARLVRVTVRADAGVPLHAVALGTSEPLRRSTADGRSVAVLEVRDPKRVPDRTLDLPGDFPIGPSLAYGTGTSWQSAAALWSKSVDDAVATADLHARVDPIVAAEPTREGRIRGLTALLRGVRSTGIEPGDGDSALASPAITLERGWGDPEDLAVALVALLRTAGIPAEVALVAGDDELAPHPTTPGVTGFHGALVRIPGPPVRWIDPTQPDAGLDTMPRDRQGRRALVLSRATRAPITTPDFLPATNHIAVEMTFPSVGPASTHVREEATGWIATWRRLQAWGDPAAIDHAIAGIASEYTGRPDVLDIDVPASPPPDGGYFRAFRTADVPRAGWGPTHTRVNVPGVWLSGWLPDTINLADAESDLPENPVNVPAFDTSETYRFVIPAGHVLTGAPADAVVNLHGVGFTRTFQQSSPTTWAFTFTLTSPGVRLTPAQAGALGTALREAKYGFSFELVVEHPAQAAMREGRYGDAIRAAHASATGSPSDMREQARWAWVLQETGFGEEARRVITKATAGAPGDPVPLGVLAWVLATDVRGRATTSGRGDVDPPDIAWRLSPAYDAVGSKADRAILIRALEAAVAARPEDLGTCWRLAEAHLQGDVAGRFQPGADFAAAGATLAGCRARAALEPDPYRELVLFEAGLAARLDRWDTVRALADTLPAGPVPTGMRGAADSHTVGREVARARLDAATSGPEERRGACAIAWMLLTYGRNYAAAATFFAEVSPEATTVSRSLALLKRIEDRELDPGDPATVLLRALAAASYGDAAEQAAVVSSKSSWLKDKLALGPGAFGITPAGGTDLDKILGPMPIGVVLDTGLGTFVGNAEGSRRSGWLVTYSNPAIPDTGTLRAYATWEGGTARLRGLPMEGSGQADEILARLDRNDRAGAAQWAAWAIADAPRGADGALGPAGFFQGLVPEGTERDPDRLRLLAATMLVRAEEYSRAAEAAAKVRDQRPDLLDVALTMELISRKMAYDWAGIVAATESLQDLPSELRMSALSYRAQALLALGRDADVRVTTQTLLAEPSLGARAEAAHYLGNIGDFEGSFAAFAPLMDRPDRLPLVLNNWAWTAAFDPSRRAAAEDLARTVCEGDDYKDSSAVQTLAVVLLEMDKADEAAVLHRRMYREVGTSPEIDPAWDYVRGRLAEAWGLPDLALEVYKSIPDRPDDNGRLSVRELIAGRVKALSTGG